MVDGTVRINIETSPSVPNLKIITIAGNFDTVTSKQVDEKIVPLMEKEKTNFVLNLSDLIYLSSIGVLRLIKYLTLMTDEKRLFKLVKPPKYIYNTLLAAGVASRFDIYDSLEEAISSF